MLIYNKVEIADVCRRTGLDGSIAHEIAVSLSGNNNAEAVAKVLSGYFPKLEVKDWQQLSPEAGYLVSAMN